jgi:hypothetical protein
MSTNQFLSNENMTLLWDVLMENEIFQNKPKEFLIKINNLINQNLQAFYEQERNNVQNLIELNKKFISLLLNHIQKMDQQPPITKKTILVTSEEIQNHRQTQFEKDLNLKQKEFTNAMTLPVPPTPVFKDNIDQPLSELELEIKKTIAQRNYDIEVIQNNIHQVKTDPTWLTSQETSVKKEKLNLQTLFKQPQEQKQPTEPTEQKEPIINRQPIKYIKIENQELDDTFVKKEAIDLNRHVSWSDESNEDYKPELKFFKKFKVLEPSDQNQGKIEDSRLDQLESKISKMEQILELILKKLKN